MASSKVGHSLIETQVAGFIQQVRLSLKNFHHVLTFNCKGSWKSALGNHLSEILCLVLNFRCIIFILLNLFDFFGVVCGLIPSELIQHISEAFLGHPTE